jgi:hypothetical protein
MKGFINRTVAGLCLAGGLAILGGCYSAPTLQEKYQQCVDPCTIQRYGSMARQSVNDASGAQVSNGHVLDQTIWNDVFEKGTDKLTPAGQYHLNTIARRRPAPDPHIFLQSAQDVPYDAARPEKFVEARNELNLRRRVVVERYLQAITADRPVPFQITVHDPAEVGMSAAAMLQAITRRDASFTGLVPSTGASGFGAGAGHAGTGAAR